MISKPLAIKLRDAGFPQKFKIGDWAYPLARIGNYDPDNPILLRGPEYQIEAWNLSAKKGNKVKIPNDGEMMEWIRKIMSKKHKSEFTISFLPGGEIELNDINLGNTGIYSTVSYSSKISIALAKLILKLKK